MYNFLIHSTAFDTMMAEDWWDGEDLEIGVCGSVFWAELCH